MKKYSAAAILTVALAIGFIACNSNRNPLNALSSLSPLSVSPPFSELAIGCSGDVVQNKKGGEILYESGSKLIIPPNAFVDKEGNPIEGEVKVGYREFHSSAEIMVSGIPMNFKNKDGSYDDFESAGMFEITAQHNGEEVNLAEGKNITCQTVTHKTEENFNFYNFNDETKQWEEIDGQNKTVQDEDELEEAPADLPKIVSATGKSVEPSEDVQDLSVVQTVAKPNKPRRANPKLPVFEIGSPANEKSASNEQKIKSVGSSSQSKLWQFAPGYDISKEAMEMVLTTTNWNKYGLEMVDEEKTVYRLDLGQRTDRPIYITPVLFGKDYTSAMADYSQQLEAFNQATQSIALKKRVEEKNNLFFRTAQVSNMGIYNWDRIKKKKNAVLLQASFELENGDKLPEGSRVFMITGRNKDVITFYPAMYANFAYQPNKRNALISILPSDEIAVFTHDAFKKLKTGRLRATGHHKFTLKTVVANIGSVADLQKLIDTL